MQPDLFHRHLLATAARWNMFPPGARIGVAVSGGGDSVALFRALHNLAEPNGWRIVLLHVNHRLRGAESDGDARFVRELAAAMGLFCEIADLPLSSSGNLEQEARDLRRQWLRSAMERTNLHNVAQGHTLSDQAETVLFRFLRGSGTAGLAGIRPVTPDGFVRPLLALTRQDARGYLEAIGQPWREDSSNRCLDFDRNRIRLELLPGLARDWNPEIEAGLAATAEWARAEEDYWDAAIPQLAATHLREQSCTIRENEPIGNAGTAKAVTVRCEPLTSLPLAAARRLVRHAFALVKGNLREIAFAHVEQVLHLAAQPEGTGRFQVPGIDVLRSFDQLRFAPPGSYSGERNFCTPAPVPGRIPLPESDSVLLLQVGDVESLYNENVECLDWDRIPGPLELRTWRPGNQYRPLGATSEAKLKQLFQELRVPIWERRTWPVLAMAAADNAGAIVWSRQFGVAADFAAGPASRRVIAVSEQSVSEQPVDLSAPTSQYRNQEPGAMRL